MHAFWIGLTAIAWAVSHGAVAAAHEFKAGGLVISHPWTRALPPGAPTGAGYLTIRNAGTEPDLLTGATIASALRTELHDATMTAEGVMQMRPLENGIEIAPGASVILQPGGPHLMFIKPTGSLKAGGTVPGTLTFAKAGTVLVEFLIEPIGTKHSK